MDTTTEKRSRASLPRDRETPFTRLIEQLDAAISAERYARQQSAEAQDREAERRVAFCVTPHGEHDDIDWTPAEPEVGRPAAAVCLTCGTVLAC